MTTSSPSAGNAEFPAPEDLHELRDAIESLRDHVQIVWHAIDEIRDVINEALSPDSPDIWSVEPPQGLPLGRYRPFAGYNPFDEWNEEQAAVVETPPVLPTSPSDGADDGQLPEDVREDVRTADAVRLRGSEDSAGMDSLADTHRYEDLDHDLPPIIAPATEQRSLWNDGPVTDDGAAASTANGVAEAAERTSQKEAEPRAAGVAGVVRSQAPQAVAVDTSLHQQRPYTLDDWITFRHDFADGQLNAAAIHAEFRRMQAGKQCFIGQLVKSKSAHQLRLMAMQQGIGDARRNTKQQNAVSLYRSHLAAFTLDQAIVYQPMQETYDEAVERIVLAMTDESIAQQRAAKRRQSDAREKALTNPETYQEYSQFVSRRGVEALSDEQLATWDRLNADITRQARQQKQNDSVEQFQSAEIEGLELRIIEGFHDREHVPLWIVQLTSRVERATFQELKVKASQLGGWWSSFKKESAGFQFRSKESAEKFAGLAERDVDRSEELLARKLRKMDSASERLTAVADSLDEKAAQILAADDGKLKNTVRRADMAASTRAQAFAHQADAKTLRSIAVALATGEATYLDGLWNATQVRTLETILRQARRDRIRGRLKQEGSDRRTHGYAQRQDELESEPLSTVDARFARFPKPYLYRGHLTSAFAQLGNTPGVKQATAKLQKLVASAPKDQDFVEFVNDYQVELLEDFLARARAAGCRVWWFDHCLDSYKRLRSAHMDDGHELRAALRELVPHLAHAAGDDPVTRAEDELRGKDLPGFFPTPRPVIDEMLDLAGIDETHRILEPSCGKGDILDAIRREHPDADLVGLEQNLTLQGVLTAKGYGEIVQYGDFLEHQGAYDRIVMNPPFESGCDIDHVRHAYGLLARGGRLVSVVCEGPFFRSDQKSVAFREWLDEREADVEQLPEDAFQGVDAFRQTSVKTRLIVIDKP